MHSDELKSSDLSFLYDSRKSFYNYQIIKSYLGMAKRNYKILNKKYSGKKASHFVRGVLSADTIFNGVDINDVWKQHRKTLSMIKNSDEEFESIDFYRELMDKLREKLNKKLEAQEIPKYMKPYDMFLFDEQVKSFCTTSAYMNKQQYSIDYGMLFYETYKTDVQYK